MPEPTTVWLARPGMPQEERGTLSMEAGVLAFVSDEGVRTAIRISDVRRVRRHRGTPVLEVRYRCDGEDRLALMYFAEPPPLERPTTPSPLRMMGIRGLGRMPDMHRLRGANRRLKPLVEAWVEAVREAAG